MILQNSQRKHFYRIFNVFIVFAVNYLYDHKFIETPPSRTRMPANKDVQEVIHAIWGEGGHLEVLDAFANDPTIRLNRTDKAIVLGWRKGIYDSFFVCRQGNDIVFLYDEYAFCVRGITDEIDVMTPDFPTFLHTVIVPFDGLVTYLVCLESSNMSFEEEMQETMLQWVQNAKDKGLFVRTARQFEKVAPEAVASRERHHEEKEAERAERESHADDVLEGEHRGELADLTWEERTRRLDEISRAAVDVATSLAALVLAKKQCLNGRPQDSEAKAIAKYGVATLREWAKSRGVEGWLSRNELVDYFMAEFPPDAVKTLTELRLLGASHLASMRKLVEAGGRLHVKADGSMPAEDIPRPMFPWVNYYREPGGFVVAAPLEIVEALKDTDWDAEIERADSLEDVLAWLTVAVDMRGVIESSEAWEAVSERYPGVPIDEVKEAIRRRSNNALIDIVIGSVDGQEYLAAHDLYDHETHALMADDIRDILMRRQDIPPYWPTEEEGRDGIYRTSLKEPAVQAFIRFLDEHVPDEEDDLIYADLIWRTFVTSVRVSKDMGADLSDFLKAVSGSFAQAERLGDLSLKAVHALPMRNLNGNTNNRYHKEMAADKEIKLVYKHF